MDYDPNDPQQAADAKARRDMQQRALSNALTQQPGQPQQQPGGVNFYSGTPGAGMAPAPDAMGQSGVPQLQTPGSPQLFPIAAPVPQKKLGGSFMSHLSGGGGGGGAGAAAGGGGEEGGAAALAALA